MVAVPDFLPKEHCTERTISSAPPLVETALRAKRRLPLRPPVRVVSHSSALEKERTFCRMAWASDSES